MAGPKAQRFDRRITEGPLPSAVWHLAWPTILQNMIGGLQGMLDHSMVGHAVGFRGNAAIGVSWQIFLVVVVFISSLYTGMAVFVARFVGAGEPDKVNRTVYQAFLTSLVLGIGVMAPVGYFGSPYLLQLVNAAPEVQAEALPYLRIMFIGGTGLMLFFMFGGALRAAGDARTPLRLGIMLSVLHVAFNFVLIRGMGPIPALGTKGAALGDVFACIIVGAYSLWLLFTHRTPVWFSRDMQWKPDFTIIRGLFRFGLPSGFQGVAMNIGGVLLLRFIGSLEHSAAAQGAYSVGYNQLFTLITWTSVGLMGATAAVAGQNLGAGKPDRAKHAVNVTSGIGLMIATGVGLLFWLIPQTLFVGIFGLSEPTVLRIGEQLLHFLGFSGLFVTVALVHTGALQGTGDTRSPFYISIVSQVGVPLGYCFLMQRLHGALVPGDIWLAILLGHITRAALSVARFRQGKWISIAVDIDEARPAAPVTAAGEVREPEQPVFSTHGKEPRPTTRAIPPRYP
jgi:putative MATE family efflux protein